MLSIFLSFPFLCLIVKNMTLCVALNLPSLPKFWAVLLVCTPFGLLRPSKKEIDQNSRSRSAKLRFAIRSKDKFKYPVDLANKFKKYLDLEAINV